MRKLEWFKHGYAYNAKFTGFKVFKQGKQRYWNRITVFVMTNDRIDAIREVERVAGQYGYQNVTVDHMVRVG